MRPPEQYADDLVVGIHSLDGSKTKLVEIKELATRLFAIAISTAAQEQAKQRASIVEAARAVAQQRDDYRDQMRVLREENYRLKNPTAEKLSPDESWPCWCTHKHFRHDKEPNTRCTECQCNRYDPMPGKA